MQHRPVAPAHPPLATGEHVLRPTARWAWVGVAACAGLTAVNLVLGTVSGDRAASNVAGTLALAPTLTAIGGARRHVVGVGLLAAALAGMLCLVDDVPALAGTVICSVVLTSLAGSAVVAGVRQSHLAQLQDRRQAARTLQAAMLTHLPQPDHLQLASRYLPAGSGEQVGGDWYDALVDRHGSTTLVIGDVTGHDMGAAASMGQLRAVLRAYAVEGGQLPSQVLARTESALELLGLDILATALVVRVDQTPQDTAAVVRRVTWSSAGHPLPVLLVAGPDGTPHAAPLPRDGDDGDLMLGVALGSPRRDHRHPLPPGATLLLHTDGLVERRGSDLDTGTQALCRELERAGERDLDTLLDVVLPAMLHGSHDDDVAVLGVRAHPEDRPRPAEAPR